MKKAGRLALSSVAVVAALSWTSGARAQVRSFELPAGAAVKAIPEFARQAGIQIIAPAGKLVDVNTPELRGEMDVRAALLQLIAGTGLEVVSDSGDVIVLRAVVPNQSGNADPLTVEEVIVTATRRNERLQDVALSISALGEAQLAAMGADGFLGFYRTVPGLSFNQDDPGRGQFIIRGINSGADGDNQAPVAVYIDEFPSDDSRGGRSLIDLNLFDVQRVEVLRGPQGTLFGSGALGGAIRVITNKPDPAGFAAATDADVSTLAGGENSYAVKGMLNVPLVDDKLAVRAVGYYRDDGGYVDNLATGRKDVNSAVSQGGRVAAKLFATDDLALTATIVHQQADVGESGALDTLIDGRRVRSNRQPSSFDSKLTTYNLVVDYDFGAAHLMSSTTFGHKETDLRQGAEEGLLGLPLYSRGPDISDNVAQELRLTSALEGRASWVAGAFFFKRKRDVVTQFFAPGAGELFGAPTDLLIDADIHMQDTEKALYGEFSYAFTDHWKATAGLRWFDNDARYHDRQQGLLIDGVVESGTLRNTESEVTPKFVLSYAPTSNFMSYASAAKGYRIGGTNVPNPGDPAVPRAYTPDSLWNYEIGAKSTWLDNRLSLNAAVYYIDWKDIQIERTSLINTLGYQDNGGAAHSQGLEIEASVRPLAGLTLSTALSWNSARSDETVPGTIILDGDKLPDARDFTGSFTVDYAFPLSATLLFFTRADYQYVGDAYAAFSNATAPVQDAYSLVNLRVGLQRGAWTATLYADNLLNDDRIAHITDTESMAFRVRPRSIGLNVRAEF